MHFVLAILGSEYVGNLAVPYLEQLKSFQNCKKVAEFMPSTFYQAVEIAPWKFLISHFSNHTGVERSRKRGPEHVISARHDLEFGA
jgi:hypothetical protein